MKAAQYRQGSSHVYINEVPIPKPGDRQLLVKIACATLCHSDIMPLTDGGTDTLSNDSLQGQNEYTTLGHEATGHVVEVGDGVTGFKQGDPVGFLNVNGACCKELSLANLNADVLVKCEACKVNTLVCFEGTTVNGFSTDGFFAEYAIVDSQSAMVLPADMDLVSAAPLFCAGVTSFNAIAHTNLEPGEWIGIVGCGGLGHLGLQYAVKMGLNVVGIDISDDQLYAAKGLGAKHVFNSATMDQGQLREQVKRVTGGGLHAVVVFSAAEKAYTSATPLLRYNGLLMVIGLPKKPLELEALSICLGIFRVKGSSNGTTEKMRKCIEFSHKHGIHPHISGRYKLDQITEMVDKMKSGKTVVGRLAVVF